MISYRTKTSINTNTWNHIALQYSGLNNLYYLYSNGSIIYERNGYHPSVDLFDRIIFGSNVDNENIMDGFIDSIRISSCERYIGSIYQTPLSSFDIDDNTETFNNFEDPVFTSSKRTKSTEKYWINTKLNKSSREYFMGKRSLIVNETTMFLPGIKIPGIDMNELEWTVEFFFLKQSNEKRKLVECGNVSIYIKDNVLKLNGNKRTLCKLDTDLSGWNHVFISHSKDEKCLYIGINGSIKKYNRSFKIVTGDGVVLGSPGPEMFFDGFRISSCLCYHTDYEIPNPKTDKWSHIEPTTIIYTDFEKQQIEVSNITSFSVDLFWEETTDPGFYSIFINDKKTSYNTREPDFTIYDLEEDTHYKFSVYKNRVLVHHSIEIKTKKEKHNDNLSILTSIVSKGVYDMELVPKKAKKEIYMNNIFDENDRILVPNKNGKIVANFAPVNSTIRVTDKDAILIPFDIENGSDQMIHIESINGEIIDISFDDKEENILIEDKAYKIGDSFIIDGKKVRVSKI